jgi:hypothetical protein
MREIFRERMEKLRLVNTQKIRHNYMVNRFKLDLVSMLPLDLVGKYLLPDAPIVGNLLRLLK